ncbi:unnamed protein product [Adineta ricciae]|nr:unnamed protein product [Adineta ricciae]
MLYARLWVVFGGILILASAALYMASAILPSWGVSQENNRSYGLWKYCIREDCWKIPLSCSSLSADSLQKCMNLIIVRMFLILSCIFSGIAALIIIKVILKGGNPKTVDGLRMLSSASFTFSIIAFPIGIKWTLDHPSTKLSTAAILAIVGNGVNFIGALIIFITRKPNIAPSDSTVGVVSGE